MYSGVPTRAPNWVKSVRSVSRWSIALATPKSITLGTGFPSMRVTSTFDGLMSRWMIPLLMRVLDRPAHRDEQLEPMPGREPLPVAVLVDRDAVDQLHHEVRPAGVGGAGVEDPGDAGVVHQGQGLALGLEAGDDLLGIHARLDDLQRDLAMDGPLLLGEEDDAHAALAEPADDRVGPDARAGPLGDRAGRGGGLAIVEVRIPLGRGLGGGAEEAAGADVGLQQLLDLGADRRLAPAGGIQERGPLGAFGPLEGLQEQGLQVGL